MSKVSDKTIIDIMDDITKVIYLNYLNVEGKEEELKSHDDILNSLKKIKPICKERIDELQKMQRDKSNEIFS